MRKIDPSRPYGEIHGDHFARFEQDGLPFDGTATLMVDRLTDEQKASLEKMDRLAEAKARAEAMLKEAMGTDAGNLKITTDPQTVTDGDVDLQAWAAGTKNYQFFQVTKACRALWNKSPANKAQAIELVRSNGNADLGELIGAAA